MEWEMAKKKQKNRKKKKEQGKVVVGKKDEEVDREKENQEKISLRSSVVSQMLASNISLARTRMATPFKTGKGREEKGQQELKKEDKDVDREKEDEEEVHMQRRILRSSSCGSFAY